MLTGIIAAAGAPAGLFQNVHVPVEAVSRIIADRRVAAVTLTGSPAAGARVAAQAGAASKKSVHAGARVLAGGSRVDAPGWYYPPTVLDRVTPDMPVVAQETFGPVAALQVARDADEAVAMANASDFGLSTMLWTADLDRARQLARRFEVGGVFVNSMTASDPRLPVGGVKLSGYGRELGRNGMLELCNLQTVWMLGP